MELPDWISRLKGPDETDAIFVIRRLAVLVSNEFLHEHLYDELDIPLVLAPGPGVPNRTRAKCDDSPLVYQTSPLTRRRPVVGEETRRPLIPPKLVSRAAGIGLVDLARASWSRGSETMMRPSRHQAGTVKLTKTRLADAQDDGPESTRPPSLNWFEELTRLVPTNP